LKTSSTDCPHDFDLQVTANSTAPVTCVVVLQGSPYDTSNLSANTVAKGDSSDAPQCSQVCF
jgi:hypothetical protein